MADDLKVKAKLEFDSNAKEVLEDIRDEFKDVRSEMAAAREGGMNFFKVFAANAAANYLGPMVGHMKEMATAAFNLGNAAYDSQQGVAGMMAAMEPREWEAARGGAEILHSEIQRISIAIGTASEEIRAGHRALATFLGSTSHAYEVAGRNIESLTAIANVTGLSVETLGSEFGQMASGMVRVKSPLFNLLKSTGIFADDISKVTAEWQKLTDEERLRRLESSIAGVAGNLAEAAPTVTDMLVSMKETGKAFLESFGGAFIREIIQELGYLRGDINEAGEEFKDFSKALGKDFGKVVIEIINELREAIAWVRENADEIRDTIVEGFRFAKDAFQFMLENAGTLAAISVGGALAKGTGAGAIAGSFAKGAVGMGTSGMAGQAGAAIPALISAIVAGGPPIWAATAAVTALGGGFAYLAVQGHKANQERRKEIDQIIARERERNRTLIALSQEDYEKQVADRKRLIELADLLGEKSKQLARFNEAGADTRALREQYVIPAETAAENLRIMKEQAANAQLIADQQALAIEEITLGLANAVKSGDTEVSKAILSVLLRDQELKKAFLNSADTVKVGADGLALALKALEEMDLKGGFMHKFFAEELKREFPKEAPKMQVNFNGGQTFKIQQEFRNQDPDSIAIAFEDRFTRAAVSRVQASTSAPFGA